MDSQAASEKNQSGIRENFAEDAQSGDPVAQVSFSQRAVEANNPAPLRGFKACCTQEKSRKESEDENMLWTIFVILLVLWLLGLVTSYTLGGFIHILLVIALVVLLIQLLSGRRAL
jgi:hypothetical protein